MGMLRWQKIFVILIVFTVNQTWLRLFTGRNEVLAKVIFSQACVCPQGGWWVFFWGGPPNFRGGGYFGGVLQIFRGVPFLGGCSSKFWGGIFGGVPFGGGYFFGGCLFGGVYFLGGCLFGGVPPPEYGQRSAGTHPTGMHSCSLDDCCHLIWTAHCISKEKLQNRCRFRSRFLLTVKKPYYCTHHCTPEGPGSPSCETGGLSWIPRSDWGSGLPAMRPVHWTCRVEPAALRSLKIQQV